MFTPTPSIMTPPSHQKSPSISIGAIAGGVAVGVLVILVGIVPVLACVKWRRVKMKHVAAG